MCYKISIKVLIAIQKSLEAAKVEVEPSLIGNFYIRNCVNFNFAEPVIWRISQFAEIANAVDEIFAGDKQLTKQLQTVFNSQPVKVKAFVHWSGNTEDEQAIEIHGLSIFLSHDKNIDVQLELDWHFTSILQKNGLLNDDTEILKQLRGINLKLYRPQQNRLAYAWFSRAKRTEGADLQKHHQVIQDRFPVVVKRDKSYQGESAINPGFIDIDDLQRPLYLNDKRIWVLRSDFKLILGVKNAYHFSGNRPLQDAFFPESLTYLNINDRYGHPSLTQPDPDYEGNRVYYAGHIAQRDGYLEVLHFSGRFTRDDAFNEEIKYLEAYIAKQLQKCFGDQPVVFILNEHDVSNDADYLVLSLFYLDKTLQDNLIRRVYTSEGIDRILVEKYDEFKSGYASTCI